MTPRALVTDIEGTTTDIAFVHQRLFPLARAEMARFLRAHEHDADLADALEAVRLAVAADASKVSLDQVVAQLLAWMDVDAKITPLKAIQGAIWREAYARGGLVSHVYDDVAPALRRLHASGVRLFVYSSGSVEAQRLLFRHTSAGDLTPLLSGYFDTTVGPKREATSYSNIAASIGGPAEEILFVSDVVAELDAARTAGLTTLWMVRPGCVEGDARGHARGSTFDVVAAP